MKDSADAEFANILENPEEGLYMYYKYVSVVPHIFVDKSEPGHEVDFKTNSYSITQNKKP